MIGRAGGATAGFGLGRPRPPAGGQTVRVADLKEVLPMSLSKPRNLMAMGIVAAALGFGGVGTAKAGDCWGGRSYCGGYSYCGPRYYSSCGPAYYPAYSYAPYYSSCAPVYVAPTYYAPRYYRAYPRYYGSGFSFSFGYGHGHHGHYGHH